jgi:hypothetical protein
MWMNMRPARAVSSHFKLFFYGIGNWGVWSIWSMLYGELLIDVQERSGENEPAREFAK